MNTNYLYNNKEWRSFTSSMIQCRKNSYTTLPTEEPGWRVPSFKDYIGKEALGEPKEDNGI